MEVHSKHVAEASIEATIVRADGTVERLGVIDSYKAPRWRILLQKVTKPWRQS